MDQHERIAELAAQVRRLVAAGDVTAAAAELGRLGELLGPHSGWEEAGLFARLRARDEMVGHVQGLEAEHRLLHERLLAGPPADWAVVLDALDVLDRHIYKENFGTFPGAIAVLDAEDWDAIDAARPA